ncbi:unnamed protein product [Brassicogethes aeneus]|uniref:Major facilitator superfamily (MFS) profile domain-containing protein n=1 Tax=Brassicogethes aeneus TaxID=1431903 RepID=A0A9P0BIW9_BRAAE|nr:unnamed protein product [Brassicogethes aeneus]
MEKNKEGGGLFIYFAAFSVNLITFSAGSAYSWTSPVLPKLKDQLESPLLKPPTIAEESWISSLTSLGALGAPILAGILSEKIGRKRTLLAFSIPMLVSHAITAFAGAIELYFVARFLVGLGCGCVYSVVPNYLSEISEDRNRGLINCFMTLMITTGLMFNYVVGPFVTVMVLSFGNMVPLVLFLTLFAYFVPESPYYFIARGDKSSAESSLVKLRGKQQVQKELLTMMSSVETVGGNRGSFKDIVKSKALIKGLVICNGLMVIQQFSGINAVLGFMEQIFISSGSSIPAEYSAILVGGVQMLTVIVSTQLIDRLGRKILLIISCGGSCIALTSMGLYFYLKTNKFNVDALFWLPLFSLILYIISFNLGLSCVPWALMGEIFPTNLKSIASTITTCFCLALAFVITMFFPQVSITLGMAPSFWGFSVFSLVGVLFTHVIVPETKGKSMSEIQEILGARVPK